MENGNEKKEVKVRRPFSYGGCSGFHDYEMSDGTIKTMSVREAQEIGFEKSEPEKEYKLEPPAVAPAHVWQLVKQIEESAPEANNRLGEMVATLLINYGPNNRGRHPVLIAADDQPVTMLVKVLTYYVEKVKNLELSK